MNIDIMRTFYFVNQCQDEPLPGYRHLFHAEYSRKHPEYMNEQNVIDRWKAIIKHGYLTEIQIRKH